MHNISIVIITKNAARKLKKVLQQATKLSDDIILVDSGSTDETKSIASQFKLKFVENEWLGYGKQKNYGNNLAHTNWILSIDADEVLSDALIEEIKTQDLNNPKQVFEIPFKNNYCGKIIHHGRWKNERHVRLFNKTNVRWNTNSVHEGLNYQKNHLVKLKNPIIHYSMETKGAHLAKAKQYAALGAKKLHQNGKKATFTKRFINPVFRFVRDYVFRLGFLDGALGLQIALIISKETYWKYSLLHRLNQGEPLPVNFD